MEVIYIGYSTKESEVGMTSQKALNFGMRNAECGIFRNLHSKIRNEKGIALVMVLMLSTVALLIMAGLIYMLTTGTQVSGLQKRYETASEAGLGGTDVTYQLIGLRGETASFLIDMAALSPVIRTPGTCSGTNQSGTPFTGLPAKINTPTSSWSGCNTSMVIDPNTNTTYDMVMVFTLGTGPTYNVYSKIVDTVEGNSAGDEGLINNKVVDSNSGEIKVMSYPYVYTIEVDAENTGNPSERAKYSILYLY